MTASVDRETGGARYWVIAIGALALCGASIVAIDWGMYHLMLTGSCASGGPYVSAKPCPPGTGAHILALMGGIFGGLIGVGLFYARGRSGERRDSPYPLGLAMWTLLFCTLGGAALYATLGPAAQPDASTGTAIFLAALFVPMGLAPLLTLLMRNKPTSSLRIGATATVAHRITTDSAVTPSPPLVATDPPASGSDPAALEKIEKLGELRSKGLITEAEFEVQKQKLLRDL